MREIETIRAVRALFPASPRQKNAPFACDAELLDLHGELYGLSMDEFSAEEDLFPVAPPETLGRNLAVAVIADILAAGCRPEFYLHAMVEPPDAEGFSPALARGVQAVLAACGCFLLGGDMGKSRRTGAWRYTGFAFGRVAGAGPLTRVLPSRPQALWITGDVGDGNLCALLGAMPAFELRLAEAGAIQGEALSCMDTSGGLAESLLLLRRLNPAHRIDIAPDAVPYADGAVRAAQAAGLPVEGFAFGGAGEYELLFTTDENAEADCATRIGTVRPDAGGGGVFWGPRRMPDALPDARSFRTLEEYAEHLVTAVRSCLA
jgi:thiamine monophosphate kinase